MSKKILLADDSITIQKVIGITFANEDFELTVVDNGADAVAKAAEIKPDLVLSDVIMPEKDGYEVCREIKADPSLSGTPVILLTGTFEPFDEAKSAEVGADDYITKPFESQTLIDKVREQLSKAPAAPVSAAAVETAVATPSEPEAPVAAAPQPPVAAPSDEEDIVFDLGADEVVADTAKAPVEAAPAAAAETADEDMWAEEDFGDVASEPAPATEEESVSDEDIWGDMDLSEEPAPEPAAPEAVAAEEGFDEFAFEEEIPGVEDFMKEPEAASVEEDVFEFEEEEVKETPSVEDSPVETAPVEEVPVAPAPEPEAAPAPVAEPVSAVAAQPADAQAVPEEQLRALLSQVSKDVIEKVVWEVVPELAETLIKEEIKKLKASS